MSILLIELPYRDFVLGVFVEESFQTMPNSLTCKALTVAAHFKKCT